MFSDVSALPSDILYMIKLGYIYIYCYCYFYLVSPFIPPRNLDEVFTYIHMTVMSLLSRSHVKASMVLTIADHLCIHNYIR